MIKINFDNCKNEGSISTLSATSPIFNMLIETGKMMAQSLVIGIIGEIFYIVYLNNTYQRLKYSA